MKNTIRIKICTFCGSNDIKEKYQAGPGLLKKSNNIFDKNTSPIIHEVCMSCGRILSSKVEDVSKIK